MNLLDALFDDQRGTTAIQYALIAGILSVAVLAGSLALRGEIIQLYELVGEQTNEALGGSSEG